MRCYFTLLVVFSLSGLGLAAPGGEGDNVGKGNALGKGDIVWVRPKDLTPKDPEQESTRKGGTQPFSLVMSITRIKSRWHWYPTHTEEVHQYCRQMITFLSGYIQSRGKVL
jgi:hypothetical protein